MLLAQANAPMSSHRLTSYGSDQPPVRPLQHRPPPRRPLPIIPEHVVAGDVHVDGHELSLA
jgi:hypothetical protein